MTGSPSDDQKLLDFLSSYGDGEEPQNPSVAHTDTQLKSLVSGLALQLREPRAGTLVDVGSGRAVLLSRLVSLDSFGEVKPVYCAVEETDLHEVIIAEAFKNGYHRCSEILTLREFYDVWPSGDSFPRPHLVVVRNVWLSSRVCGSGESLIGS